ncbi:centromere protein X isoform X2 [Xenopus laevis]|uniref:Centromere protein X isoform X2 n=1 Tax=Xenopus laevis TaxID=8355 RepID=A0A8J1LTM6_XENLA|nr:centromere protein X isoform X2 [Xenopus laevis]
MERDQDEPVFLKGLVSKLLHEHLNNEKVRASADALLLLAELLKVFVRDSTVCGVVPFRFPKNRYLDVLLGFLRRNY